MISIKEILETIETYKGLPPFRTNPIAIGALDGVKMRIEMDYNNDPIPLEELKQMSGEPVWIHFLDHGIDCWMLAYSDIVSNRIGWLDYRNYGEHFVAYREKPEE
jgi:hypothetical protein